MISDSRKCNFLILEDDVNRMMNFQNRIEELRDKTGFDHRLCIVNNVDDCKKQLYTFEYDFIFLDHDLEGKIYVPTDEYNTGSEIARFIRANYDKFGSISIYTHTLNDKGGYQNILNLVDAEYYPGLWMSEIFNDIF